MAARNKIVINGSIGTGGVEQWSTGFVIWDPAGANPTTGLELTEWADDVMVLLQGPTEYGTLRAAMSPRATIDNVAIYRYDDEGPAINLGVSTEDQIVGSGEMQQAPQISVVFSLLTGFAGRSRRGRCYWPGFGIGPDPTTMMMGPLTTNALATEFAQLLGAVADAGNPTPDHQAQVYSPTLDLLTPVTEVSVGSVFDTQRRRRDNLVEIRSSAPVNP